MASVEDLQAQARAKLAAHAASGIETFIDPTQHQSMPIIVQRVVPRMERPAVAKHVLEGFQASFAVMLSTGKRVMFVNYRFETDDDSTAEDIIRNYAPKIWRV